MKRMLSALLLVAVILFICSCAEKETVVNEIYKGSEYMTIEDARTYLENLLGEKADMYEVDMFEEIVRFSLKEDDRKTDWLERTVDFSDGTSITLPCMYSDVSALGWKSEGSENETWTPSSSFSCRNNSGWRISFVRDVESNRNDVKVKDSKIEKIYISCGDFAEKDSYVLILSSHPEFEYMGIDRESTPEEVIIQIGLPKTIEHNGVNMTVEYESTDYSIKEQTTVEISWLTLKDGPAIMRDIEIARLYMSWLLR